MSVKNAIETRKNSLIQKNKAEQLGMSTDVISYLVGRLDIKQVESALLRVAAYSAMVNREVTIELVEEALQDEAVISLSRSKRKERRRNWSSSGMVAMLSGLLLLNGCSFNSAVGSPLAEKASAQSDEASADAATQSDITLPGKAIPFEEVTVSPSIAGNVQALMVEMGAYVTKDQTLAQIDESDLGLQIKQAEAHVKTVEAQAQAQSIEQQIRLNEVKASLEQGNTAGGSSAGTTLVTAEASLAEALDELEKAVFVFEHGGISEEELQQKKNKAQQVEQQIQAHKESAAAQAAESQKKQQATAEVAKLQQQAINVSARLTQMGRDQALADLELVRYQYNNLTVKAPIAGFITAKEVITGDSVSPSTPLFVITNLDKLYIQVDVPEAVINRVKVGQHAHAQIPSINKRVEGKVAYVAPMSNAESQSFPVRILVENAEHLIKGGMKARVRILFESEQPEPTEPEATKEASAQQEG
ncbi:hypothetical protein BEP19_13170 [Ammoniphilus oxalaticus]|uniref:Uncharacterized protein n=1 Tax=Ammoniphilus oxalaticus TaxID=66863 RepID=A0A419SHB7_9BACL|nr:efflux RND transporter periplasmic adaptor subunit [Ammoniphilus oxalaticus]RKD23163.1 hypothetical protein BEP19_13170 [Ammoniphilus oxalaticus]